ncbi:MAG: YbhB/YbcL family Raf kinase inhibitor-like protein [Anaerolineae bacterium]|nr:YbhB/YbcL family Raf kinase inhibitor-like protein [Anaerolineae bacterium]MDW8101748.1 YbhB/YbcL family Raf kinase inhibitor-like protein [Anaerolineae bacterium]
MKGKNLFLLIITAVLALSCRPATAPVSPPPFPTPTFTPALLSPIPTPTVPGMSLFSPAFTNGSLIPERYTCKGENISPPLGWTGVPAEAKSLVLICDDPDAPGGPFNHWLLYNIPPSTTNLPEGVPPLPSLPDGSFQGFNSFGKIGYDGPCPPPGSTHRYFFRLYALDKTLNIPPKARKAEILRAMEGHILAVAELMGRFSR